MLFNLFRKQKNNISKAEIDGLTVNYKIYSVAYNGILYYAETKYENVLIRTVIDLPSGSFKRNLNLCQRVLNNRFGKIVKEAAQHGLCSYPSNHSGECILRFKWDKSKIIDTTLNKKKIDLIYKVSSEKQKGGLSECYVPLVCK